MAHDSWVINMAEQMQHEMLLCSIDSVLQIVPRSISALYKMAKIMRFSPSNQKLEMQAAFSVSPWIPLYLVVPEY